MCAVPWLLRERATSEYGCYVKGTGAGGGARLRTPFVLPTLRSAVAPSVVPVTLT
jgi:hypothetical protein